MRPPQFALSIILVIGYLMGLGSANLGFPNRITTTEFRIIMDTVARGWNSNDARLAADCFTNDAVYSAPPSRLVRHGKKQLFEFFGGAKGRDQPMHMEWHHLMFNEDEQIGAGEYTFTYQIRTHGVAIVRFVDGKIANWREYEQISPLPWNKFVGENHF